MLAIEMLRRADDLIHRAREITTWNQEKVERFIDSTELLDLVPSKSSICFPRYNREVDSLTFAQHLLEKSDTLVVPGTFFEREGHFRLGLGFDIEDVALNNIVSALEDIP